MMTSGTHGTALVVAAALAMGTAAAESYENYTWLNQSWSQLYADDWYKLSQGSQLVEMKWITSLDTGDGVMFSERSYFRKFGYPYATPDAEWPIGFVPENAENGREYIGLNCAACHTSELEYDGHKVLIHGGQSFGDLRALIVDLKSHLRDTLQDEAAFGTFHNRVGGDYETLKADVELWLAERDAIDRTLEGTVDWVPGSADAVAYINAATTRAVSPDLNFNVSQANAPVNYPPAWNANQQERLQHSGSVSNSVNLGRVSNSKIGALVRNIVEAYGVFTPVRIDENGVFSSAVRVDNLINMEQALSQLQSPTWPEEIFGEIDMDLAGMGRSLFEQECSACHGDLAASDIETELPLKAHPDDAAPAGFVYVQPVVDQTVTSEARKFGLAPSESLIGTDPMMVCNFIMHTTDTGNLEGRTKFNTVTSTSALEEYRRVEPTSSVMGGLVLRDISRRLPEISTEIARNELGVIGRYLFGWALPSETTITFDSVPESLDTAPIETALEACADFIVPQLRADPENVSLPGYKARPLNGIWATPPFLHNGSVPTMWHLLQPQEDRPARFYVGSKQYDPELVGLAGLDGPEGEPFIVYQRDFLGNDSIAIPGQWNGGHEYGVTLSDDEKRAIVEYLKTL